MITKNLPNAWKEIDIPAVKKNIRTLKATINKAAQIMAIVKTNAYGHNMLDVAKAASQCGITWFGVSNPAEGIELRKNLPEHVRILILEIVLAPDIPVLIEYNLTPVVCDFNFLDTYDTCARKNKTTAPVHLAVDTGMGRIGIPPAQAEEFAGYILKKCPNTNIEGIFSHFSSADETQCQYTKEQFAKYCSVCQKIEAMLPEKTLIKHTSNSAAGMDFPDANFDIVRFGIALYGISPFGATHKVADKLSPVMSVRSRVTFIKNVPENTALSYGRTHVTDKPTRVATVSIGYGHGLSRLLSNRFCVLINGKKYNSIGTVTMSQILVDIQQDHSVCVGDIVTVIGQDGTNRITARQIADTLGTIPYEVGCGYSKLQNYTPPRDIS